MQKSLLSILLLLTVVGMVSVDNSYASSITTNQTQAFSCSSTSSGFNYLHHTNGTDGIPLEASSGQIIGTGWGGVDTRQNIVIDPNGTSFTSTTGCSGFAQDPVSELYYGNFRDVGNDPIGDNWIAIVDPFTGVGTAIGNLSDGIQSIAFNSTGHLFGWTNSQAENGVDILYGIDKSNGSFTGESCQLSPATGFPAMIGWDYTNDIMYVAHDDAGTPDVKLLDISQADCNPTSIAIDFSDASWSGDGRWGNTGAMAWETNTELFYGYSRSFQNDFPEYFSLNPTTGIAIRIADDVAVDNDSDGQKGFVFTLITAVPDLIPPVITANEQEPITILLDTLFVPNEHATCIDDVDGDLTSTMNPEIQVDTSVRGSQTQDYGCQDTATNQTFETFQFIVKKKSTGGSSSSGTGGTTSSSPSLSSIPTLSFQDSPSTQQGEGRSIADLFASLFDNRITDGITTPAPSGSSPSPASTESRTNPIAEFFQNFFMRLFG